MDTLMDTVYVCSHISACVYYGTMFIAVCCFYTRIKEKNKHVQIHMYMHNVMIIKI